MKFLHIFAVLFSVTLGEDLCPPGTKWMQLRDGTWDCIVCNDCPRGTVKAGNCSEAHDTICKPCDANSYYSDKKRQCQPCAMCSQGESVKRPCSKYETSECEPCPKGTFSSTENSISCTNCTVCTGYKTDCNFTQDAVCKKNNKVGESGSAGGIVGAVIAVLVAIAIIAAGVYIFIYRGGKFCWSRHSSDKSASYTAATQEESCDHVYVSSHGSKLEKETKSKGKKAIYDHQTFIKEFKEEQMKHECDLKQYKLADQLTKLSSSVGVLFCSKPKIENTSDEEQDMHTADVSKLAVCRVGSKFVMTAFYPLRDMLGTSDNGDLNHSRFEGSDVYVVFDGTKISSSERKFRLRASSPEYINKALDIVVVEILIDSPSTEIDFEMNENKIISQNLPPPFCLHTSLPIENVIEINVLTFDNKLENKGPDRNLFFIKAKNDSLDKALKSLSDHSVMLNNIINKPKNENLVMNSKRDIAEIGNKNVCWTTSKAMNCFGCPGIIFDKGCCKMLCLCSGRVPKILEFLPPEYQELFKPVKSLRMGTLMSEVYKRMKTNNPALATELFYEVQENKN